MTTFAAKILADSVGPHGVRLTTLDVVMPRHVLAEFNTHRALSRNSESSRAVPPEKRILAITEDPAGAFIPDPWPSRRPGMEDGAPLPPALAEEATRVWKGMMEHALAGAQHLIDIGVDKTYPNRAIEPYLWHRCIVTATDWENFYALRIHPKAQQDIRRTAEAMLDAMRDSTPVMLNFGQWHLPLITEDERRLHTNVSFPKSSTRTLALASAGRCAKVSYDTHLNPETILVSGNRGEDLTKDGHWSPTEHPALCVPTRGRGRNSNFKPGWLQLRKLYPTEHNAALLEAT